MTIYFGNLYRVKLNSQLLNAIEPKLQKELRQEKTIRLSSDEFDGKHDDLLSSMMSVDAPPERTLIARLDEENTLLLETQQEEHQTSWDIKLITNALLKVGLPNSLNPLRPNIDVPPPKVPFNSISNPYSQYTFASHKDNQHALTLLKKGNMKAFNAFNNKILENKRRLYLYSSSFRGQKLAGADMRGVYLASSIFTDAEIKNCDFTGADLSNAKLFRSTLVNANFSASTLSGVDLSFSTIKNSRFDGSDMVRTGLSRLKLDKVSFYNAILSKRQKKSLEKKGGAVSQ